MFLFGRMPAAVSSSVTSGTPSRRALRAEHVVFLRFTLKRLLGQGGMGSVWLAYDVQLDREVALKFMQESAFRDPAARHELRREARRSLELTHPNVVRIHDYIEDEDAAAICMEYVDGSSLSKLRVERENGAFEVEDLRGWLTGCCAALDYAHRHACIVHRDLKPSNIIVTSRGTAKIADLGISCGLQNTAARISAWATTGGTLSYMSPQQLTGELAAPSDDIYSLGATIYELLTSKPPFHSGDISYQIRNVIPEPVDMRRTKLGVEGQPIPVEWVETIAACLEKDPANRPRTVGEVAERLGLKADAAMMGTAADIERSLNFAPLKPRVRAMKAARYTLHLWFMAGVLVPAAVGWLLWPNSATPAVKREASAPIPPAQTAAPQAPLPAGTGGLVIKSSPSGAKVFVGETEAGVTPCALKGIASGSQAVRVEMAGFEPMVLTASVRPNEFTDLGVVNLPRSVGALVVQSEPQDCAYTLLSADGATEIRKGRTPEQIPNLPTGNYRVVIQREGWPVQQMNAMVERQATSVATHRFGSGMLAIATDPAGAEIRLGERLLGRTPLEIELPSGTHTLVAALPGYRDASFQAQVNTGETTKHQPLLLAPQGPKLSVKTDPAGLHFRVYAGAVVLPDAAVLGEGMTPVTVEDLPAGRYTLVFDTPPWPVSSRVVDISPRSITEVMQEYPAGTLAVTSQPEGAKVLLNGDEAGHTPLEIVVPIGTYEISAEWKGRTARTRTVELGAEETETIKFDFSTSTSTKSRSRRVRKPVQESVFKKVGRSIQNFFTGDNKKK
jgi:tRNA A-37 threonylcarbamoyl transferase component Bud32